MLLFQYLIQSIEQEFAKVSLKKIKAAYEELSNYYRNKRECISLSLNSEESRLAYVAARMPATFGAVARVFEEIESRDDIFSVLDVGAGCGTASFASMELFPNLSQITLIEQNEHFINLGKRLINNNQRALQKKLNFNWLNGDMAEHSRNLNSRFDIVICSYSLNELNKETQLHVIANLWEKVNKYLVIVEPGSKDGFQNIHNIRQFFVDRKSWILAPCSHANVCPAFLAEDWCHFSARIQRSSMHKYIKDGDRGFEDEKFSYLIIGKSSQTAYQARVVKTPSIRPGHIIAKLCAPEGIIYKTLSKKDKVLYKKFKNLEWGSKLF